MLLKSLSEKIGQYTVVLLLLLLSLVMLPLVENFPIGRLLLSGWCLLVVASLVLSLIGDRKHRILVILLGTTLFLCIFVYFVGVVLHQEFMGIALLALFVTILFLGCCIWLILYSIFKRTLFSADVFSGAILAYILLGIAWGALYSSIEKIAPGSFSFSSDYDLAAKGSTLTYYSFITLTTLGYGDILPLTRITRTFAYLEAVTGVMYCAILVAGLVGNIGKQKPEG